MATSGRKTTRNNLDSYFNDLYEKEIQFTLPQDEVERVQNAVETIVLKVVDKIGKSEPKLSVNMENLMKVGSFYEGTKICYPDEFDFICIFQSFNSVPESSSQDEDRETKQSKKLLEHYQWYLERAVRELEMEEDNIIEMESGKLILDTEAERHGPASKLCLYYVKDGGKDVKGIHADITAAIRVKGPPDGALDDKINEQLKRMVKAQGNHLLIFNYEQDLPYIETFTETEIEYITNVMSVHHRKVFKVLKYLINGKHTTEQSKGHVFSSYSLKTVMFQHNFECNEDRVSTCILSVLKIIQQTLEEAVETVSAHALKRPIKVWYNIFTGKSFSKTFGTDVKKCKRLLRRFTNDLKIKIERQPDYCYENCSVKPLIEWV